MEGLIDRNVPVDCVGMQMHIDITYKNRSHYMPGVIRAMREFGTEMNMTLMVTEFDAKCTDDHADLPCTDWGKEKEQDQADLYLRAVEACLDEPKCISFETWGWTDAVSFATTDDDYGNRHPFPFDDTMRAKPAYYALKEGIYSGLLADGYTDEEIAAAVSAEGKTL